MAATTKNLPNKDISKALSVAIGIVLAIAAAMLFLTGIFPIMVKYNLTSFIFSSSKSVNSAGNFSRFK